MGRRPSELSRRKRRRSPTLVPLAFLAAASIVLACATSTRAEAAPAPDSARVAWVRLALLNLDDVWIATDSTKLSVRRPVVSSDGLRFTNHAEGWGISSWTPAQDHLVAWS